MLLASLHRLGLSAAQANDMLRAFPQRLVAVPADRSLLPSANRIWEEVDALSEKLGNDGRIVLRASGTEPLVRVMVEAPTAAQAEMAATRLCAAVERTLGRR